MMVACAYIHACILTYTHTYMHTNVLRRNLNLGRQRGQPLNGVLKGLRPRGVLPLRSLQQLGLPAVTHVLHDGVEDDVLV